MKGVSKTIKIEEKEQKVVFLSISIRSLNASLLGH